MSITKSNRQRRQLNYTLGLCFICNGYQDFDHEGQSEDLLKCVDCHRNVHAICYQLDRASAKIIQTYDWQCNDCKSCLVCHSKKDESKIVICSQCDRGCHTFCCDPSLKAVPADDWYCKECSSMPSPPTSLPSSPIQPLTPLSDNQPQKAAIYQLRRSPAHSAKFIESTIMAREKRAPQKKKQALSADENKTTKPTRIEPLKLKLTVAPPTIPTTPSRKRGRPKYAEQKEEEEKFFKTFGHKLTKTEANIKRGTPAEADFDKFEKAKSKTESLLNKQLKAINDNNSDSGDSNDSNPEQQSNSEDSMIDVPKIKQISFNNYLIDTWYVAPYPEEYSQSSTLYICEFCMKYMKSSFIADRHKAKCKVKYPPGDEIYRDGKVSVFEVDGRKNKIYCQNLCLMAKMFLDHKTLYYDVEPFLFYIMTESDELGCHFVGYFSKEKRSAMNYNVSCILTMPIFQRKGYGQFLIDFSYLLSKKESKTGSPERPLSDLGLISYRSYWKNVLFRELENQDGSISIDELSNITSLTPDDIISTLQNNNMIHYDKITKHYSLVINPQVIRNHLQNLKNKNHLQLHPNKLKWTPFVLSRDRLAALLGQAKMTIKDVDESNDVDID